jgi:hypothetical protein
VNRSDRVSEDWGDNRFEDVSGMLVDRYLASHPLAFTAAKAAANVDDGHGACVASLFLAKVYHLER